MLLVLLRADMHMTVQGISGFGIIDCGFGIESALSIFGVKCISN
jgi:hypothetical protein